MIRPNASLPELLANREWIHQLARSIVADEDVRDDVVQDAWLTAWRTEAPPTRDARGWLAAIVRNFARQRARSETRRARRERGAARPEAQPATTSLTERAELQQRAVAAVLALPEPGRTLLLERFFEGLGPQALAARHDCPVETIRTRLKTALARVRDRLEREDRAGAWRALATAGVLVMTMKTKVALAAIGLLVAGGVLYPVLTSRPEPLATASAPDPVPPMTVADAPTGRPANGGAAVITGHVACDRPAPIIVGAFAVVDGRPEREPAEHALCDQDHRYRLRLPHDGPCLIVAQATEEPTVRTLDAPAPRLDLCPGAVQVSAIVGQQVEAPSLHIGPGHVVTGRALRADGRPLAQAMVVCLPRGAAAQIRLPGGDGRLKWWRGDDVGRLENAAFTDADGRFRFAALPAREHSLRVLQVPNVVPHLRACRLEVTPPADVELRLDATELTLEVWTDGVAAPSASVTMRSGGSSTSFGGPSPLRVLAARQATYTFDVAAEGFEPQTFEWQPAGNDAERRLVELRAAVVRVVTFELQGDSFERAHFRWQPLDGGEPRAHTVGPTDGRFVFRDLPAGRFRVTVQPAERATGDDRYLIETSLDVDVPQADAVSLPLRLQKGGALRLRADGTRNDALDGRCDIFDADGTRQPMAFTRRTDSGHIDSTDGDLLPGGPNDSARNLPPGRYRVEVRRANGRLQTFAIEIVAGETSEVVVE